MCACVLSCSNHVEPFVTLWTTACHVPLSMGFSRQEYWTGLPCPPPGNLPDPGLEPVPPVLLWFLALQVDSLPLRHQESPMLSLSWHLSCLVFSEVPGSVVGVWYYYNLEEIINHCFKYFFFSFLCIFYFWHSY